ncbi:MAG: glutamate synthase central domain-containing protein, partial [Pseudomonadales bacterium]
MNTNPIANQPFDARHWEGMGDPWGDHAACGVGALVDLEATPSHAIVEDALALLGHLDHRGARGAEEQTGDGAGILLQKPRAFFRSVVPELGESDSYAVGMGFFPQDEKLYTALRALINEAATERHFELLAWRHVPTTDCRLGRTARNAEPRVEQFFLCPVTPLSVPQLKLDLYVLRRIIERRANGRLGTRPSDFYLCSLDLDTIIYKGMLTCAQLARYYTDLSDARVASAFAMVHSRFSTNTLGAWHLAHPCRCLVHNGEFNTLRGNENWMRAREADLELPQLGRDVDFVKPVLMADASDTAKFDNVLELLLVAGRSLPHALRMMIPEAWENDPLMPQPKKDFYDFHSTIMEPWDGPALVVATDGRYVAAIADRNGFRPCRYCVTEQGRFVLASEAGVLDIDERSIVRKGRLQPGGLLVLDTETGRLLDDETLLSILVDGRYAKWLKRRRLRLPDFNSTPTMTAATDHAHLREDLRRYRRLFGYTQESIDYLMVPMAEDGTDPIGAMGDDAALAAVSKHPQVLAGYFRQMFAQVSNPPLDFIRERVVTSLSSHIGRQRNILASTSDHCHQVLLQSPILTEWGLEALKNMDEKGIRAHELDATFAAPESLSHALDVLCDAAVDAIDDGFEILVISDRKVGPLRLPIPSLMAIGAVHHALIDTGLRTRVGLVMDVGDTHTVHHFCTLIGYGADAIHPWLAFATLDQLVVRNEIDG